MTQHTYLTADQPGIGGVIKRRPEDFFVEEQPLYTPQGTGEHLYLCIEKTMRSTSDAIRYLSRTLHVGKGDIGYAGLKDKYAVTRQMFSVYLSKSDNDQNLLDRLTDPHYRPLGASRHTNKLQRGHLKGNRFVIRIRQAQPGASHLAKQTLDYLARFGVPNFVGEQRFGYRRINHQLGRLLLLGQWQPLLDLMLGHPSESDHPPTRAARQAYEQGDFAAALDILPRNLRHDRQALDALRQGKSPRQAVMLIDRYHRSFLISAMQSAAFNHVLNHRLQGSHAPGIDRLVEGDLAWKHDNRSAFSVDRETAQLENAPGGRVQTLQVSPSGPMWGVGMLHATGRVGQWERQALAQTASHRSRSSRRATRTRQRQPPAPTRHPAQPRYR